MTVTATLATKTTADAIKVRRQNTAPGLRIADYNGGADPASLCVSVPLW